MLVFLAIFASSVLFFGLILLEITQMEKRAVAQGFGPKAHVRGSQNAYGTLICVNADAPTFGQKLCFPYQFRVASRIGDLSGVYEYAAEKAKMIKPIYTGHLFLRFQNNRVKGRAAMGGLKTIEGGVDQHQVKLRVGHPKGGILGLLSGNFEYSVDRGGNVRFDRTSGYGSISEKSRLNIQGNRITGRILHGPQTTWAVDVDVTINGIPTEQAALAVILASNDIVSYHHD